MPAPRCAICGCILNSGPTRARGVCKFTACVRDALNRGLLVQAADGSIQPAGGA